MRSYDVVFCFRYVPVSFEIADYLSPGLIWLKVGSGAESWALMPNLKGYFALEASVKSALAPCNFAFVKVANTP